MTRNHSATQELLQTLQNPSLKFITGRLSVGTFNYLAENEGLLGITTGACNASVRETCKGQTS